MGDKLLLNDLHFFNLMIRVSLFPELSSQLCTSARIFGKKKSVTYVINILHFENIAFSLGQTFGLEKEKEKQNITKQKIAKRKTKLPTYIEWKLLTRR